MKQILLTNLVILLILSINIQVFAQKDKNKKDKTVKLKIETIENGKKVLKDTTFTIKNDEDLNKILEKYGVNADVKSGKHGTFKVKIDDGDSLKHTEKQMVWVNVDNNGGTEKIHITQNGKEKKIIISDDADVKIIDDDGVIIDNNTGDSSKHVKKIIRKHITSGDGKNDTTIVIVKEKGPKHMRIKKVYKFDDDSLDCLNHKFFFGNVDNDLNKMIIKELGDDSLEIFISKILGKNSDLHFDFPINEDFIWNGDNDFVMNSGHFKHQKATVKLEAPVDTDLSLIKLDKNYKKLDLDEFMVVFNGMNMDLSFTSKEKGDLSLNIYDEKGNSSLVLELKGFKGIFEKEIILPMGNQILKITLNKKHFVKKLKIE